MAKNDYYDTLGIKKGATDSEIKKAYRNMAKKHHPDLNPDNKESETKFKEINEAYEILSDQKKKSTYDQFGHAAFENGGGGGAGGFQGGAGDMGDIFEQFFGGGGGFGDIFGGGGGRSARRNGPRRGADLRVQIQIEFEQAVFGMDRSITLDLNETCESCKGSGAKEGTHAENCKQCGGSGVERVQQQTMFGMMVNERACSACHGEGKIIKTPCPTCGASGKVKKRKTIDVKIPAGIDSGQSIKKSGLGEPGVKGGSAGDMLITVIVAPHKYFERNGMTLYMKMPISFSAATLGGEITIPTIYGDETYNVKAGTQTGTNAILKGKGVPNVRNEKQIGDLVVTLNVVTPTSLNEKQKEALKTFAEEMGENTIEHKKGFFNKFFK